jgi:hypothetical protein
LSSAHLQKVIGHMTRHELSLFYADSQPKMVGKILRLIKDIADFNLRTSLVVYR